MEDERILDLFWRRDETALLETSVKYGAYCQAIAHRILANHEDAEECVNDTWNKAWNAIPPQRPDRLGLFLARITRNLAFDALRVKNAGKRGGGSVATALDELEECLPSSADVERDCQQIELNTSVDRFLHGLPRRECDVFLRRYFFLESIPAIASRYVLKPEHVLVILSRTRRKMKRQLAKEGYDP